MPECNAGLLELGASPRPCGLGEAGGETSLPGLLGRLKAAMASAKAGKPAPKAVFQRNLAGIIEAEQARLGD